MRIRFKPWARPELEASKFYIDNPEEYKGKWRTLFNNNNPIHLELGCGKGGFISQLASSNLDVNYIAIDMVDVEKVYSEKEISIDNIYLTRYDIERILMIMDENDKIDRIYINFCNPWPRGKHRKKRLTHTRQLEKYKQFLKDGGEIYFKTDDDGLFNDSLLYFEEAGFEIEDKTFDLANNEEFWNNIETEHEKMFKDEGIKIKAAKVKKINRIL